MSIPFPYAGYSEDVARRVRVVFNGDIIVDSHTPKLVWEHPYYPVYYFPIKDITISYDCLQNETVASDGDEAIYDLVIGGRTSPAAVTRVLKAGPLMDHYKIGFDKADLWLEEDERMLGHPRDPYKRIQILQSSKHVRIEIDGVEVANTTRPKLLYETGLPVRKYIPFADVKWELLRDDVGRSTSCPYKGDASYYTVRLPGREDKTGLAWWYKTPLPESTEIRGHVAFYDEKVDVWVDGEKQEKPATKFS
ncbi:hypothetical protein HFD88_007758 [Aspergillus terreus]|nr:hypothetical protein HFD88_007758 [Aspergillus terreus]